MENELLEGITGLQMPDGSIIAACGCHMQVVEQRFELRACIKGTLCPVVRYVKKQTMELGGQIEERFVE